MKCPTCSATLIQKTECDVDIDVCTQCNGIWFDAGELKPYIDTFLRNHPDISEASIELNRNIITDAHLHESNRLCPFCNHSLQSFNYATDSNVILEKCYSCGGIWVDGGKVLQIAQFFKGNPTLNELGKALALHHAEIVKMKEFGELFDTLSHRGFAVRFLPKFILPIKSDVEVTTFPVTVFVLIFLNLLVYLYQTLYLANPHQLFSHAGLVPGIISTQGEFFRFFTAIFLHVNIFHLAGNMLFLWIFGCGVESSIGRLKFLFFYLLCGISAGFLHYLLKIDSMRPAIGASGSIAGVMGGFLVLFPYSRIRTLIIIHIVSLPAWLYLGAWICWQLLMGFVFLGSREYTFIGWYAHIGGFLTGMALMAGYKSLSRKNTRTQRQG